MGKNIIIEPDLDERHLDGYYFQKFYCSNCHLPWRGTLDSIDVMIPKGQPRPTRLECPNCELETLK